MSYKLIRTYEQFQAFEFKVDDIKNYIGSFLFNSEVFKVNTINAEEIDKAYFNVWKEKMKETLSAIDKGWKYIAVYKDEYQNTIQCISCYLKAFILKTSYVSECQNCSKLEREMYLKRYDIVNFDHIKQISCQFQQEYFGKFNIGKNARIIVNISKYMAERNLYLNEYRFEYIWLDNLLNLDEEIRFGPLSWNSNLEKKRILQKMYPNSYEQYKRPIPLGVFTEDTMDDLYPIRYY
jgi:ribosomal protein S8